MSSTSGAGMGPCGDLFDPGPAEGAMLAECRKDWLGLALSTAPADRPRAAAAIAEIYRFSGIAAPAFAWVDSPAAALDALAEPGQPLGRELWARLRSFLYGHTRGWEYWTELEQSWIVSLMRAVHGTAWTGFHRPLHAALLRWASAHDVEPHPYIGWEARATSQVALDRLLEAVGYPPSVFHSLRLEPLEGVLRTCGWWWPYEQVCVVSERPVEIHTVPGADGTRRLHREDGPAVRYRDGWTVWAWRGTAVPRWVIEAPESITPSAIRAEQHADVQSAMLDRMGLERYLEAVGVEVRDEVSRKAEGVTAGLRGARLLQAPGPDDETLVVLEVRDPAQGRSRKWLRVHPGVNIVAEAAAWTFGFGETEAYAPTLET